MKTKSRAGRATVSKVPSKPSSMATRVLNELVRADPRMPNLERLNLDDSQLVLHKRDGLDKLEQLPKGLRSTVGSLMERSGLARENEDDSIHVDGGGSNPSADQCVAAKSLKRRTNDVQEAHADGAHHGIPNHEATDNCNQSIVREIASSSDGYHDRGPDSSHKMDVDMQMGCVLSSQNIFKQDSLETADWSEEGLCIKCNEGDQVLTCNSNDCPLVVHENCLGFSASFDDMGNFYCPFCLYKKTTAETREAKKKVLLAKKALSEFLGTDAVRVAECQRQVEPSITFGSKNMPCREEETTLVDETHNISLNKGKIDKTDIIKNHQCMGREEQIQTEGTIEKEADVPLTSREYQAKQKYGHQRRRVSEDQQQAEPSTVHSRGEETILVGEVLNINLTQGKQNKTKMFEESQCTREEEQMHPSDNIAHESSVSLTTGGEQAHQVDHQKRRVVEHQLQREPSIVYSGYDLPGKENSTVLTERIDVSVTDGQNNNQSVVEEHQAMKEAAKQMQVKANNGCETSNSPCRDTMNVLISRGHAKKRKRKAFVQPRIVDPLHESSSELNINAEENAGNQNEEDISLRKSIKHQGPSGQQVDHQQRIAVEDQLQKEPSIVYGGDDLPGKENSTLFSERIDVSVTKIQKHNQSVVEEFQAMEEAAKLMHAKVNNGYETSNSPCRDTVTVLINRRHANKRTRKTVVQPQIGDPPHEPSSELNTNAEETDGNQDEDNSAPRKSIKHQGPSKRSSNPAFPNSRRKKLPWTAEEEEVLKEGVQKFSSTVAKNLPWRKILEFGCHVFDGTRTPVDLKDKWRNLLIKEGLREGRR